MSKNIKLTDLIPDNRNYNKGTEFGNSLIEKSLIELGAGRSILIDKNNRIIAGNKTVENASSVVLDNVIVVETNGNQLVAVKRTDIDLDSEIGRKMALADNATSKANLNWDDYNLKQDWSKSELKDWGVNLDFKANEEPESEPDFNFTYVMEVECKSEGERAMLYDKLIKEGLICNLV